MPTPFPCFISFWDGMQLWRDNEGKEKRRKRKQKNDNFWIVSLCKCFRRNLQQCILKENNRKRYSTKIFPIFAQEAKNHLFSKAKNHFCSRSKESSFVKNQYLAEAMELKISLFNLIIFSSWFFSPSFSLIMSDLFFSEIYLTLNKYISRDSTVLP